MRLARTIVMAALAAAGLGPALACPARAGDRPAVIVTNPGQSAYKVAVQRFRPLGPTARTRPEALRADIVSGLEFSGFFEALDSRAFLGPVESAPLDDGQPLACGDWRQGGTDAVVQGQLREGPGTLEVEFRVWDVVRCRNLLRKRYRGEVGDARRMAHRIADDVVEAFTGRPGVSSTEIAFVSSRRGNPEIYVMDADGGRVRAATRNRSINAFPSWSPDGRSIVYMSYRYRRSPHLFRLVRGPGRAGRLLPRLDPRVPQYRGVYARRSRQIAAVLSIGGAPEIFRVDENGRNLKRLTRHRAIDVAPTWSPDDRRIAFVSDRAGTPQIYVMDADGSDVRRLTFDGTYNAAPAWSPDGSWIAYQTRVNNQFDIWLIDPLGRTNVPLVTHPRSDEHPSWSPDGRKLVFQSTRRGRPDLYVIDVDGRNLRRLTRGKGEHKSPDWGPLLR